MTNSTLFKQVAATNLPEDLFQQIEPHLDSLLCHYQESEQISRELNYIETMYARDRYDLIRAEFNQINEKNWPEFARERWPEIDNHFNLEWAKDKNQTDSDFPF